MSAPLILASGSVYRRELLSRLRLPFDVKVSSVDETRLPDEPPLALARRLAEAKAAAVATGNPGAIVIGSDQVAACGTAILGKPGNAERNRQQLEMASGQAVQFFTAVCLMRGAERLDAWVDTTIVRFRPLTASEIARHVELEPAFDCAGGFKAESLGITLFESIDSHDPTALIGLPLIRLAEGLRRVGVLA